VNPVRNDNTNSSNFLTYNTTTNEITYNSAAPLAVETGTAAIHVYNIGLGSSSLNLNPYTLPANYSKFLLSVCQDTQLLSAPPTVTLSGVVQKHTSNSYIMIVDYNSNYTGPLTINYIIWAIQ
jgi:hypothetical protein